MKHFEILFLSFRAFYAFGQSFYRRSSKSLGEKCTIYNIELERMNLMWLVFRSCPIEYSKCQIENFKLYHGDNFAINHKYMIHINLKIYENIRHMHDDNWTFFFDKHHYYFLGVIKTIATKMKHCFSFIVISLLYKGLTFRVRNYNDYLRICKQKLIGSHSIATYYCTNIRYLNICYIRNYLC
jgi:hypothetical protein